MFYTANGPQGQVLRSGEGDSESGAVAEVRRHQADRKRERYCYDLTVDEQPVEDLVFFAI